MKMQTVMLIVGVIGIGIFLFKASKKEQTPS